GVPRTYQRKILAAGVDAEVCMERRCCRALGSAVCKNDDGAAGWNAVIGELPFCQACGQVRKVPAIETLVRSRDVLNFNPVIPVSVFIDNGVPIVPSIQCVAAAVNLCENKWGSGIDRECRGRCQRLR